MLIDAIKANTHGRKVKDIHFDPYSENGVVKVGISFEEEKIDNVQDYSGLSDLERAIHRGFLCAGVENVPVAIIKETAKECLELAKKELLSYADESNPAIEAMADLERTFECNPDKLPLWLKNELTKKHLEGYTLGKEATMREMSDFLKSHFNCEEAKGHNPPAINIPTWTPPCYNGGPCTNPQMDCINCPRKTTGGMFSTSSGTSTATLHGNTSATDGKEHNPSFTD